MWACALATARTAFASTARGLAFWSQMRTPVAPPFWFIAGRFAQGVSGAAAPAEEAAAVEAAPGDTPAFARYRSSGGHASAQVIVLH
jgi:hypothetical protein